MHRHFEDCLHTNSIFYDDLLNKSSNLHVVCKPPLVSNSFFTTKIKIISFLGFNKRKEEDSLSRAESPADCDSIAEFEQ